MEEKWETREFLCKQCRSLADEELNHLKEKKIIDKWSFDELNDGQLFYAIHLPGDKKEYTVCSYGKNLLCFRGENDGLTTEPRTLNVQENKEWKNFYKYCDGYSELFYAELRNMDACKSLVAEILSTVVERETRKILDFSRKAREMFKLPDEEKK